MKIYAHLASALLLLAAASAPALASEAADNDNKSETPEVVDGATEASAGELQTAMQVQQQLQELQQQVNELQQQVQAALPAAAEENTSTTVASPAGNSDAANSRCQQLRFGSSWQSMALAARTCR